MSKSTAPPPRSPVTQSLVARLFREPLFQFALLGAVLFLLNHWVAPEDTASIIITRAQLDELIQGHEKRQQAPVSESQRRQLINDLLEEEILVREAMSQGFDRDQQVRDLLLQKMRYVLDEEAGDPTPELLRQCYEASKLQFHVPRTVTLQQVYLSKGTKAPDDLLDKLRGGADHLMFGKAIESLDRIKRPLLQRELVLHIDADFARQVFALPEGQWSGPITSLRGTHFVRVVKFHPPHDPPFEKVESILRRDWQYFRQRQIISEKVAEMRKAYNIVIAEGEPTKP